MSLTLFASAGLSLLLGGSAASGVAWRLRKRAERQQALAFETRLQAERAAGIHLCISTLEALSSALEACDPYSLGHLECVQQGIAGLSRALGLSEDEATGLCAAALAHNLGKLGVPEYLLHKRDALTPEEQRKLDAHPVLGARILASIPFPWPVVPIVRHQAEHWDGSGAPEGLQGEEIPRGARLLAVVCAYSALLRPGPSRSPLSSEEALASLEARAGTQFDPAVIAAFREVIAQARAETETHPDASASSLLLHSPRLETSPAASATRSVLDDIAAAQRETLGLCALTQAVAGSLHLEAISRALLDCAREMVPCAASVLFLPEDGGEILRAHAARGVNERHLLGSLARVGTYLTGRAFTRGESVRASFLADDLILRDVSDPWTPFRSTLIVPLALGGKSLGTLNLYAEEPDAFTLDTLRVMRLVATQASQALGNARHLADVEETAYTDAMTGLRNARYLREFLEREINRASREKMPLAVLNIDLDNFKPINDLFGHARGDQALREVAEILNSHIRNYDLAARYAGDEFVVVLSRAGRVPAETVARKLQSAVERHGQQLVAREAGFPQLGISIGIAFYPEDAEDMQGLLCRSDAAMYDNKKSRRAGRASAGDDRQAA